MTPRNHILAAVVSVALFVSAPAGCVGQEQQGRGDETEGAGAAAAEDVDGSQVEKALGENGPASDGAN